VNPVETIQRAIFMKPMSDDIPPTIVRHHHFITLLPISIGYRWSVDRQPLWQDVAMIAKEQACHPRRPLQRTDQVPDDVCIRNSPSRPLNDGGKSVEPEVVQGSTK